MKKALQFLAVFASFFFALFGLVLMGEDWKSQKDRLPRIRQSGAFTALTLRIRLVFMLDASSWQRLSRFFGCDAIEARVPLASACCPFSVPVGTAAPQMLSCTPLPVASIPLAELIEPAVPDCRMPCTQRMASSWLHDTSGTSSILRILAVDT